MRVSKSWLSAFFIFAIVIQPELFTQFRITALVYAVLDLAIFGQLFVSLYKKSRIPKLLLWWFVIRLYLLIIMIMNGNVSDIDKWGRLTILVADVILMFEMYSYEKKSYELLSAMSSVGVLFLSFNTITILSFPEGIISSLSGQYFFLGTRVNFLKFIFPFIVVSYLQYIFYGKKKPFFIIIALSVYTVFKFNISTAIASLTIIIVLMMFRKYVEKILTLKTAIISTTILSISFVFLNATNWFSWIIVNILGKNTTLTNRTMIWELAIEKIVSSKIGIIFGYGIVNNGNFISMYGVDWPPHNQMLSWLFEIGILGTVAMMFFLSSLDRKLDVSKDVYFVRAVCFSILVSGISSSIENVGIYLCFIMLAFLDKFRSDSIRCKFDNI